jgi:hypothetical protein
MGAKWGAIENMLGNTLGTCETCWEPLGDLMRTQNKNTRYSPKRKKIEPLLCMLVHLIGCQEFLCLLVFFTSFGLGRWQGHKLWGHPHRYMCIFVILIKFVKGALRRHLDSHFFETSGTPQKYIADSLWPPIQFIYLHESSTLAKACGLKVWC